MNDRERLVKFTNHQLTAAMGRATLYFSLLAGIRAFIPSVVWSADPELARERELESIPGAIG